MGKPRLSSPLWLALLLLGACASSGRQEGRGALVQVQVINDLIPPRSVTVEISPSQGGSRIVLGSVSPTADHTFRYSPPVTGTDYVITAVNAERNRITSRAFPIRVGDVVVWSLRNNELDLRRQ